jgi:uncharacterized protein
MDPLLIAYAMVCILAAAFVRGYAGFGFSLLSITALSLALPPAAIIPSIFLLEVVASIHLLPGIWRDIQWRPVILLLAGNVLLTPVGVWLLAHLPAAPMQIALGVFVLAVTLLLMRGYAMTRTPSTAATLAAGALSGICNGAFGIGGPPVILFFFSSPAGAQAGRASLITYFLGSDLIGLAFLAKQGLITASSLQLFALFLPPLLLGVWAGARAFKGSDTTAFRQWSLRLLLLLASLTLVQGLHQSGVFG